jgi:CHASE2 domain-containing sensor protein
MPRRWRFWALIALIILLVGGSAPFLIGWLSTVLPAATATVTITPKMLTPNCEENRRAHSASYATPVAPEAK